MQAEKKLETLYIMHKHVYKLPFWMLRFQRMNLESRSEIEYLSLNNAMACIQMFEQGQVIDEREHVYLKSIQ